MRRIARPRRDSRPRRSPLHRRRSARARPPRRRRDARAVRRRHVALVRRASSTRAPGCRPTTSAATSSPAAAPSSRRRPTSAMYLWATLAARDLGFISRREARARGSTRRWTASSGSNATSRRASSTTGTTRRRWRSSPIWPENGNPVYPFLSSVDNGWLAVGAADGRQRRAAAARPGAGAGHEHGLRLLLRPARQARRAGLIRGGFWPGDAAATGCASPAATTAAWARTSSTPATTTARFNTEPRIASYIGIALGQIPPEHYFGPWRTFPDTCDWSWPEQKPVGEWRDLPRRRRLRGRLPLRRPARRADVGRQHVRGADGAARRARGGVGPAELGRDPSAVTSSRRSSSASTRPATATGASRRRATRPAATASTASTPSAWSRTATPPTSSG